MLKDERNTVVCGDDEHGIEVCDGCKGAVTCENVKFHCRGGQYWRIVICKGICKGISIVSLERYLFYSLSYH